ncbi:MAG: hypothetical protein GQ542_19980 [Desulforhopalus sp.]|nr:hypothetical protein [Desulforhopalus sp.]
MPNEYSVEIHKYLGEKIVAAEKAIEESEVDNPNIQGQIVELHWIRKYLGDNIDLKDFTYY